MSVDINNIKLEFGKAFRKLFEGPLQCDDDESDTLLAKATDYGPAKLLAMWIDYLEHESAKGWQISLGKFLIPEKLNSYVMRFKHRHGQKAEHQSSMVERYYRCENLWGDCGTAERILVLDDGDTFPGCLEAPCGHCDGRMLKVEAVPIPTVADEPSKPVFDDLVPAPPSVVSLPAVSSGELSDCAPLVEWGDVDVGDVGDDDDPIF